MLTIHGRVILMVVCVGLSISTIVGFIAVAINGYGKMRKAQQQAARSSCRRAPTRSNRGVGEEAAAAALATEDVEKGLAAALARPLVCRYLRADGWPRDATCGVCLAELADGDALRVLPPCMHYFHAACVGDWLRLHATCPLSRGRVAAAARPA